MKSKIFLNEAYICPETDTLNYVTKSSTAAQRKRFDMGDIYINAAVCLLCKSYIRSKNRHDMIYCKCRAIAVDGGSWYAKRLGAEENMVNVIESFYDT